MSFKNEYLNEIKSINALIDAGSIYGQNNALEKFQNYLKQVSNLGRFTPQAWPENWRNEVYAFGVKFKKKDPVDFLKIIQLEKTDLDKDKQEVIDFFKSEIEINNQPFEDCTNEVNKLIEKYPYNPEFRHDLGHFYCSKNEFLKAIEQYEFALDRDTTNKTFKSNLFNTQNDYIENLIDNNEYIKGREYIRLILQKGTYKRNPVYHNILLSKKERLKDHIIIENKINDAEARFKITVKDETDKERKRLIEILAFFSAIIAFIFSTVSIGSKFSFKEAILFIPCLGLILILFLLTMNILFAKDSIKWYDSKIAIILIVIGFILYIIHKSYGVI